MTNDEVLTKHLSDLALLAGVSPKSIGFMAPEEMRDNIERALLFWAAGARDGDSPEELRKRATAMRKIARHLNKEADERAFVLEQRERRARSREALEARAAERCRPVWAPNAERKGGPWCVLAAENGRYLVGPPPVPGGVYVGDEYYISTGMPRPSGARWSEELREMGVLDADATLKAWREFCAKRKEQSNE